MGLTYHVINKSLHLMGNLIKKLNNPYLVEINAM